MLTIIGVTLISAVGWMAGLACARSAARRHLVLLTALALCLLLPVVLQVRTGTSWTLLMIETPAVVQAPTNLSAASSSTELVAPLCEQSADDQLVMANNIVPQRESGQLSSENRIPGAAAAEMKTMKCPTRTTSNFPSAPTETTGESLSLPVVGSATIMRWGGGAYAVIAALLLLRLVASLAAVQRLKWRGTEIERLPSGIRLLEADVAVPLAAGFGEPAIVLPRGLRDRLTGAAMEDIIAHEAEHLRRGDHWIMLLQGVATALYWPVVTIHFLNRSLTRAREELCDNAVIARRDAADYGLALLAVAELVSGRGGLQLAPSVLGRGQLEGRVARLLDGRRDRRTGVSRCCGWSVAAMLLLGTVLIATTRVEARAQQSAPEEPAELPAPRDDIRWEGIPQVDRHNPTLHRGVVLGPDGKPLAGAKVYAASTIELLDLKRVDELGPVRAVTDGQGRFEFTAPDLSWVTPAGVRKRWETLLVATKEGVAPGWLKTFGEDRSLRSHWHPHPSREVAIRTRPPANLSGQLKLKGEGPLEGAKVRLTGLMAPVGYDLDIHIPQEEEILMGIFTMVDYEETLYRPSVLPGVTLEAVTDEQGRFELPGLPEGFLAQIEVAHPHAETTTLRVAVRPIEDVYRKPMEEGLRREFENLNATSPVKNNGVTLKPEPVLYGSGFTRELPKGAVLRGRVTGSFGFTDKPAAGVIVALANGNSPTGMSGEQFTTDAEGRFEVTGLRHRVQGYELAFAGSFDAPYASRRQQVVPGEDARVELTPAVSYRLILVDEEGKPVDRSVYSIPVQNVPGTPPQGLSRKFNEARRVAPGVYEGIVPLGPGAVLVERKKRDQPVAVDPKEFFEPGRSDWTSQETRYAYGDRWHIAQPGNRMVDQLDLAAVVFTKGKQEEGVLELSATSVSAPPVEVRLVDEEGKPVAGARLERQLERYNGEELPATVPVFGLHPERAEFLRFTHDERRLIGTLSAKWSDVPQEVVLRPSALILGRIVDQSGEPNHDFSLRVVGEGVMPNLMTGGRQYDIKDEPGKRPGEFALVVPPGMEVRGELVRRTVDVSTRPAAGPAFGPLVPQPGETIELGDIVVP